MANFLRYLNILNMYVDVNHFSSIYKWHPCIAFLDSHLHFLFLFLWVPIGHTSIHLYKLQIEWIALKCVEGLCCWQWMKTPCNDFWWNGFSKYVLNFDIYTMVSHPKTSYPPPKLEDILLVNWNVYDCDDEEKEWKNANDQGL